MIASDSARVLFVHVQKTGGSSVDLVLREVLPDCYPVQGLRGGRRATWGTAALARPDLGDYFTFGVVRNPWARMVLERLGLGPCDPVPRANATPRTTPTAYRDAYTPEMREIVGRNFARDIEAFGYDF